MSAPPEVIEIEDLPETFQRRYRILERVGGGAVGDVYRARREDDGEAVIIKLVDGEDLDGTQTDRVLQEAELLAEIDDRAVVKLLEHGWAGPWIYLVFPDESGVALRQRRALYRGDIPAVTRVLSDVLKGLEALHQRGIIHRDVKPANLVVLPKGRVKLIDLGIAKPLAKEVFLTQTGDILGTPAYMAPGQVDGEEADPRDDLYSAGVVAYELLTGENPFRGQTPAETLIHQVSRVADPVAMTVPGADTLGGVIDVLLSKHRDDRYDSAREARRALKAGARAPARRGFSSSAFKAVSVAGAGNGEEPVAGGPPPVSPGSGRGAATGGPRGSGRAAAVSAGSPSGDQDGFSLASQAVIRAPDEPGVPALEEVINRADLRLFAAVAALGLAGMGALGWWLWPGGGGAGTASPREPVAGGVAGGAGAGGVAAIAGPEIGGVAAGGGAGVSGVAAIGGPDIGGVVAGEGTDTGVVAAGEGAAISGAAAGGGPDAGGVAAASDPSTQVGAGGGADRPPSNGPPPNESPPRAPTSIVSRPGGTAPSASPPSKSPAAVTPPRLAPPRPGGPAAAPSPAEPGYAELLLPQVEALWPRLPEDPLRASMKLRNLPALRGFARWYQAGGRVAALPAAARAAMKVVDQRFVAGRRAPPFARFLQAGPAAAEIPVPGDLRRALARSRYFGPAPVAARGYAATALRHLDTYRQTAGGGGAVAGVAPRAGEVSPAADGPALQRGEGRRRVEVASLPRRAFLEPGLVALARALAWREPDAFAVLVFFDSVFAPDGLGVGLAYADLTERFGTAPKTPALEFLALRLREAGRPTREAIEGPSSPTAAIAAIRRLAALPGEGPEETWLRYRAAGLLIDRREPRDAAGFGALWEELRPVVDGLRPAHAAAVLARLAELAEKRVPGDPLVEEFRQRREGLRGGR